MEKGAMHAGEAALRELNLKIGDAENRGDRDWHNLRLFVRRSGDWKLLAWANEPA
jgi:hypothetical protein